MGKAVQEIGTKHQLHVDQIGALEAEIMAAMIGVTNLEDFTENISDALDIHITKAETLAADVNNSIFIKIRSGMKAASAAPAAPAMPSAPAAVVAAPTVATTPAASPTPVPVASAAAAPTPAATTPAPMPVAPAVANPGLPAAEAPMQPTQPAQPPKLVDVAAETMLTQKTTSVAPATAPASPDAPVPYKADPYREPPE